MDTIQEAIEFLSLMEEPEYVSAIVALRARVAELEERIVQAKKQSPVLCVPASIANDCAHIAARGQFDAAIDVARRYAQPFYAAPVPSTDVCRVALEDACIVSWINADLTTVEGAKKAIASLCAFDVQLATDPATNGGKVLVDKSTTVPAVQSVDVDWLIAEVARLTAERDRYKAWHDEVGRQPRMDHWFANISGPVTVIYAPRPLKENE